MNDILTNLSKHETKKNIRNTNPYWAFYFTFNVSSSRYLCNIYNNYISSNRISISCLSFIIRMKSYKEYFSGKERTLDEIKAEYIDLLENSSARTSLEEFVMAEKDGRYSLFANRELQNPEYKEWKVFLTPGDVLPNHKSLSIPTQQQDLDLLI